MFQKEIVERRMKTSLKMTVRPVVDYFFPRQRDAASLLRSVLCYYKENFFIFTIFNTSLSHQLFDEYFLENENIP